MNGLRRPGLISFVMSLPRCGSSICSSRPARSFAGNCQGFGEVQTKARTGLLPPKSTHCMVIISSTMPGNSRLVLLPSICGCHVEIVDDPLQNRHEHHVPAASVLKLVQPSDHLPSVKPVDRAQVLSSAISDRLGLLLGPGETEPRGGGQAIDE